MTLQEVRIENDSDRKFSKSKLFPSVSENYFFPRFMLPFSLLAENIFSVFRSPHLPLDTQFWTRGFPPVMRSRKAGIPFATRARKRELSIQEVRIEEDSDRKFSKSKFFHSFSENHFFSTIYATLFITLGPTNLGHNKFGQNGTIPTHLRWEV